MEQGREPDFTALCLGCFGLYRLQVVDDTRRVFSYSSPVGGERAATTRQRLAGKTCCRCGISLTEPPSGWMGSGIARSASPDRIGF